MPYVDVLYDRNRDKMKVVERVDGKRVVFERPVEHTFYYEHPQGQHRSIFGNPCKKFTTNSARKFKRKLLELQKSKKPPTIFESDIRPEFRYLAKHYMGADAPVLNVGFFDIEADFDPDRGYAPTDDPFNAVTAISLYESQTTTLKTLVLCPPSLTLEQAQELCEPVYENGELVRGFEDTTVFDNEIDLLMTFLDLIEDVDVLTGWNSEGYDIPYLINRVKLILGEEAARRFCLWGRQPRLREYLKFGKIFKTYELVGRVHLDYLMLYQKHNTQQQHSYRLDFIGEIEVGENKIPYEGTLDQLYKQDFYRFVDYNRQDVALMVKIDAKRKFIELANQIAHTNCVLLKTTVGSVSLVEQAIINEMHALGFVVPDRKPRDDKEGAEAEPREPKTRMVRVMETDDSQVEEMMLGYFDSLDSNEQTNIFDLLQEREDEPIGDQETFLDAFGSYLRDTMPDLMDTIIEGCSVFRDVEEVIEDEFEVAGDDDDDQSSFKGGRTPVVGAYVAKPKPGIHYEVACVDINSLYPSCIRSLNMSPETIVGQVRPTETMALIKKRIASGTPRAEAWDGIFCLLEVTHMHNKSQDVMTVDFEDGTSRTMTGEDLHRFIFSPENQLCISANGTIFTTATEGIIPQLLAKWYSERKHMQGLEKAYGEAAKGVEIDEELAGLLAG